MSYLDYLQDVGIVSDLRSKRKFLEDLIMASRIKDGLESANIYNYFHMMSKVKSWEIILPASPPFLAATHYINLMDCINAGDVEMVSLAFDYGASNIDSMLLPQHWLNQERFDWMHNELKAYLGWA